MPGSADRPQRFKDDADGAARGLQRPPDAYLMLRGDTNRRPPGLSCGAVRVLLTAVLLASLSTACHAAADTASPRTFLKRAAPQAFIVSAGTHFAPDAGSGAALLLAIEWQDARSFVDVRVTGRRIAVERVLDGERSSIARSRDVRLTDGDWHQLLIKRRQQSLAIFLDDSCVLRTPCHAAIPGRIAYRTTSPQAQVREVRLQPLGEIRFDDDFARAADELGPWEPVSGQWTIAGLELPEFSSNPFCLRAQGKQAITLTGHWFWDNYRLTASVRPDARTEAVGLVVYARDRGSCIMLRCRRDRAELVAVTTGHEQLLAATPCRLAADQWVELSVCAYDDRVACTIDRALLFESERLPRHHGRPGLLAVTEGDVFFDDIHVDSVDNVSPAPLHRRAPPVRAHFTADKHMRKWARMPAPTAPSSLDYTFHTAPVDWLVGAGEWGIQSRWACQPRWTWFGGRSRRAAVIWHKYGFHGDAAIDLFGAFKMDSPFDPVYRRTGDLNVSFCADGRNLSSGYTFIFAGWGNRWTRLLRQDTVVAATQDHLLPDNRDLFAYKGVHLPWYHVRIVRQGERISCLVDGTEVLEFRDPEPLDGTHLAVWTWDNGLLLARAQLTAERITAPQAVPGNVAATEEHGSALTLRNGKSGNDFTLQLDLNGRDLRRTPRLSFRYKATPGLQANLYLQVHEQLHCVVFSAPDVTCDSAPVVGRFAPPELDERWHAARIDLLSCLDTAYPDSTQLTVQGAFLGLLSDDPYVMCGFGGNDADACCEVDQVTLNRPTLVDRLRGWGIGRNTDRMPPRIGAVWIADERVACDTFEADINPWQTVGGAEGATLTRDPWSAATGRCSLRLTNAKLGGTFGAERRLAPFSPHKCPAICFDYNIDADLRVDLHVRLGQDWFTIKFTDHDETWPVLGRIEGVEADSRWHHARVDLLALLRDAKLDMRPVTGLMFASSGFPGNRDELTYRLDNVTLIPAVAARRALSIRWRAAPEGDVTGYSTALDRNPTRSLDAGLDCTEPVAEFVDLAPGQYWFHVRARDRQEQWGETLHLPFVVRESANEDDVRPTASVVAPASGERGAGVVKVQLQDAGSGIDAASIRLTVADTLYHIASPAVRYDESSGTLTWQADRVLPRGVAFADGATVNCQLSVEDHAGNALPEPLIWSWTMDYSLDTQPPCAPFVTYVPSNRLLRHTFEKPDDTWGDWGGCQVTRTDRLAATGRHCLQLLNLDDRLNQFFALANVTNVTVATYPFVAFDVRFPVRPAAELPALGLHELLFDGQRDGRRVAAMLRPKGALGHWRQVEIDLRAGRKAGQHDPFGLLVGNPSKRGRAPGVTVHIDNFTVFSRRDSRPGFEWSCAPDASRITRYSWVLDAAPATEPPPEPCGRTPRAEFAAPEPGRWWFHVRAVDGAGNWGPAGHCRIVIEQ